MPTSNFPTALDSYSADVDGVTQIVAADVNEGRAFAIAAQTKLGIDSDPLTAASIEGRVKHLEAGGGIRATSTASAATVTLPTNGDVVPITGTTNITDLTVAAARVVRLEFAGVLTVVHGNHIHLANGVDFTSAAGAYLTLVSTGSGWYEASRSLPAPPAFATPAVVLGTAAAAGSASTAIRSDSTIVAFDATAPSTQAVGDAPAAGTAAVAPRRDHKHGMPAFGTTAGTIAQGNDGRLSDARTPTAHASTHLPGGSDALTTATPGSSAVGDSAAAGSAASFARSDHQHGRESFATPAIVLGSAAAAGSATTPIRSDGTIAAFDATAPTTSAVGDAAAVGTVAKAARRDHVHGRESFATPAIVLGTAAAAGAAAAPIRSDSTIVAFDATSPTTQVVGDAAAVGTAAVAARRDHKHALTALVLANLPTITQRSMVQGTSSSPTTTSTSYVDVERAATPTSMAVTLTTLGGDLLVVFNAMIQHGTTAGAIYMALKLDAGSDVEVALINEPVATYIVPITGAYLYTGVSAASHTVTLRWKVGAGTGTMYSTYRFLTVVELAK